MLKLTPIRITGGILAIAVAGILGASGVCYYISSRTITAMAVNELDHLVDATTNMVNQAAGQAVVNHMRAFAGANLQMCESLYQQVRQGKLTEAEARRRAEYILLRNKIGQSGYIYCLDSHGIVRVHPKRELINKDESSFEFIREQMRRKTGYLEYFWRNPDEAQAHPKALYMDYFAPWDWIISVSAYREEFNNLVRPEDFRKDIISIRIGHTGYLYIFNKAARVVVHPSIPAGTDVSRQCDARGFPFIQEMLKRKNGTVTYWWKNTGEKKARQKIVVYKYYPAFDWIITGGVYLDELYEPLRKMQVQIVGMLVLACLLVLPLSIQFGRGIVSEQKAVEMALRVSLVTAEQIIDNLPFALVLVNRDQIIRRANATAGDILKLGPRQLAGKNWTEFHSEQKARSPLKSAAETAIVDAAGKKVAVLLSEIPVTLGGEAIRLMAFLDLSERKQLELQLSQSQKLEAVGGLAAGIAHEINTPIQYIGDNIRFLKDAYQGLSSLLDCYQEFTQSVTAGTATPALARSVEAVRKETDLEYLMREIPNAIQQSTEGVERVATIVRAMKAFAHPDANEKTAANLNEAILSTITISRNEWKYVANLETDLDPDLPLVPCLIGEFNQVILNLIINAAHAIADVVGKQPQTKGRITVSTRRAGAWAEIRVADTGTGIPEENLPKIYDPFFTTKPVGRGTGQGLAISHHVIIENHGGTLNVETGVGVGTTFIVRLPLSEEGTAAKRNASQKG